MEVSFGALAVAAAAVLHPKDSVHWGYVVAASAVFVLILLYMVWAASVMRSNCLGDGSDISFVPYAEQQECQQESKPESLRSSSSMYTGDLELNYPAKMAHEGAQDAAKLALKVDGALAEDVATDSKDKVTDGRATPEVV